MSITVQRNPIPLSAWHLTDKAAMLDALDALSGQGWRAALARDAANDTWILELNADAPTRQIRAELGEWLVLDGDLRKLSDEQCATDYEVV